MPHPIVPIFILSVAFGSHLCVTPPQPEAPKEQRKSADYKLLLHIIIHIYKLDPTSIAFPPLRVLGGVLVLGGGIIRWLCYRELGKQFTFHVAILKNHELITTGPYSIVRHPSYTGGSMIFLGSLLWHGSSGAWLRESKICETKLSLLVLVPVSVLYYFVVTLVVSRTKREDELLRKEFGRKWDAWAKSVPYRLIPGVY
ncbi:hypothetical protein HYPSUDRAFT_52401 [Hypholoma sublateritium FD-334 SS-4]|uniref:Protein-S-isoprenylcysteine O-methyltransferase n=1 Tax=Hypholoma sublateritium (strain FD-334 SS-4) TaxID=945553 RepID=A0A0D2P6C2_HYPSF|nr:hypothetical protein HYPSUDRAFT_52401 [Hypholoma sublateritium FD-334 SS-4]